MSRDVQGDETEVQGHDERVQQPQNMCVDVPAEVQCRCCVECRIECSKQLLLQLQATLRGVIPHKDCGPPIGVATARVPTGFGPGLGPFAVGHFLPCALPQKEEILLAASS
jgi:hypothetical protein